MELSSGSGAATISCVTLDGSTPVIEAAWEGRFDQMPNEMGIFIEIEWHEVSGTSALDSQTLDMVPPVSTPAAPANALADFPADGDRVVFQGTLGAYSCSEVIALQGLDHPNPGSDMGDTYGLIVLDKPQSMALRSYGGDEYKGEVSIVNVTGATGLAQYEGAAADRQS